MKRNLREQSEYTKWELQDITVLHNVDKRLYFVITKKGKKETKILVALKIKISFFM